MTEFPPTSGHDESSADDTPQMKDECAELVAMVWEFIDGECNPEIREKLRKHLDECPPCEQLHELEERLKMLIGSKCRGEKAPEGLRQRLRLEISRTTIIRR